MKNIIKISSLALVALLTSCANKVAPLKKISPSDAINIAKTIYGQRRVEKGQLSLYDRDAATRNKLFSTDSFPYSSKRISADIVINHDSKLTNPDSPNLDSIESRTIKKHIFFDLDHLYYRCNMSMTYTTNDGVIYTYPSVDHYVFFLEAEKQEEDIQSDYDKQGEVFSLFNFGNLIKYSGNLWHSDLCSKEDFISDEIVDFFQNNEENAIIVDNSFNLINATSYSLASVVSNWGPLNYYFNIVAPGKSFPTTGGDTVLLMSSWLSNYFDDVAAACSTFKDAMEALQKNNSYFNYAFRSADAKSLNLDLDFSYNEDDETTGISGLTTYTSSMTFRDLYLVDSSFTLTSDVKLSTLGTSINSYTATSLDQKINYNPGDSVYIPADYREYTGGV